MIPKGRIYFHSAQFNWFLVLFAFWSIQTSLRAHLFLVGGKVGLLTNEDNEEPFHKIKIVIIGLNFLNKQIKEVFN